MLGMMAGCPAFWSRAKKKGQADANMKWKEQKTGWSNRKNKSISDSTVLVYWRVTNSQDGIFQLSFFCWPVPKRRGRRHQWAQVGNDENIGQHQLESALEQAIKVADLESLMVLLKWFLPLSIFHLENFGFIWNFWFWFASDGSEFFGWQTFWVTMDASIVLSAKLTSFNVSQLFSNWILASWIGKCRIHSTDFFDWDFFLIGMYRIKCPIVWIKVISIDVSLMSDVFVTISSQVRGMIRVLVPSI